MIPISTLLHQLSQVSKTPQGWQACCPAHEDRQPSLSIATGDDGRILLHCHAGCTLQQICKALGVEVGDLFSAASNNLPKLPKVQPQQTKRKTTFTSYPQVLDSLQKGKLGAPTGTWLYHNPAGEEVFHVFRFDTTDDRKTYRVLRRVAQGWQWGDPPGLLPLYQLPTLLKAPRVYVTEGEKAAEAGRSIGLITTTSAHGSQSAAKSDWSPLAGKEVIILPDHDEAGRQYANHVVELLQQLQPPPRIRIVELPGLAEHGDLYDFLEARDGAEPEALYQTIEKLVAEAPVLVHHPAPAPSTIPERTPFPVKVLPEPLRSFVSGGAAALGCDPSYIALPLLTACAAAIGNSHRIQLKRDWSEPAILWSAVVGESGTLKTPAFKIALQPLRDQQAEALHAHEAAWKAYEALLMEYDRSMSAWKRSKSPGSPPEKPEAPTAVRYLVSDTTVEALAPILLANPRGLLLARDELAGWIGSFDRYNTGKGADAAHWLSLHNAEALLIDRKTGLPKTIYVPRAAVSVTGGIQPGILSRSLGMEHRESGLAARLLLTWPARIPKQWSEAEIDPVVELEVSMLIAKLLSLPTPVHPEYPTCIQPVLVPLSPEGKQAWIEFYNQHAHEQVTLDSDLSAVWSKLEGYAARLALIIHLVRVINGDPTLIDREAVDAVSIHAGITLSRWFGQEAKRVYAMLAESEAQAEERNLVEWIRRQGGKITVRELQRSHPHFKTSDDARAALEQLVTAGHGTWQRLIKSDEQRGRPSQVFELNLQA
jgi:hypothetical protein